MITTAGAGRRSKPRGRARAATSPEPAARVEGNNVAMLAAGAARDELRVERVTLRIQANPHPPTGRRRTSTWYAW